MRLSTSILAAALAVAATGPASAQGVFGDRTGGAPAVAPGTVPGATGRRGNNPAGVIDGTNPNPNPGRAGGIRSPEHTGTVGGADAGVDVGTGTPARAPVR